MPIDPQHLKRMMGGEIVDIPPFCLVCGYNLTGAVSDRCPECGHYFVHEEWRAQIVEIKKQADQLKEANEWMNRAILLAIAGVVVLLVSYLTRGGCVSLSLRGFAAIIGFSNVFLGLGVFRTHQLPVFFRDELALSPKYSLAVISIVAGVIILMGAAFASW